MSSPKTLVEFIAHWADIQGERPALHDRQPDGSWRVLSWADYWARVRSIAKGLIALGLEPGDTVAIVGANRSDWVCCQFGVAAASGVLAPIYTTNTVEQIAYIVKHSACRFAIADGAELLAKYVDGEAQGLMEVEHLITMDTVQPAADKVKSLDELITLGDAQSDEALDARLAAVSEDDLTMLIFTSGTTGLPKGAMYTHRGIATTGAGTVGMYPELAARDDARSISYLPLCHAAEQGITNFAGLRTGNDVYFCPDMTLIKECLVAVRPTVFLGVPRVWEKFEAALRGRLAQATGLKAKLASWALRTALKAFNREQETGKRVGGLGRRLANKLVISKIKEALGLDDLYLAATGAAPTSRSTLEFFASLGIPLHEGYGMTETTAFATLQDPGRPRFGTIGRAFEGVSIRIAEDGEIQLRGDNMIKGYYKLPEQSAELWTQDGWMCTGDLGELDDGYLKITGRKKDILITAGGKNVAPAEIEGYLQGIAGVGQAVVVGDRQKYLAALLVLDHEALPELAKAAGVSLSSATELAADATVQAYLDEAVTTQCNAKLARYQTIKRFEVLATAFSVEGGELTPTMKVKRNVVNEKYAELIASLYA